MKLLSATRATVKVCLFPVNVNKCSLFAESDTRSIFEINTNGDV